MFEEYLVEEMGKEVIRTDHGFAAFVVNENDSELFFSDLYIKPEHRTSYEAKKLFSKCKDEARLRGLKNLTGIVSLGVKSPERSTKILRCYLSMGFNVMAAKNNQIIIHMEVL